MYYTTCRRRRRWSFSYIVRPCNLRTVSVASVARVTTMCYVGIISSCAHGFTLIRYVHEINTTVRDQRPRAITTLLGYGCFFFFCSKSRLKIKWKNITAESRSRRTRSTSVARATLVHRWSFGLQSTGIVWILTRWCVCVCCRLPRKLRERRRDRERGHHQEHDVLHLPVQSEYPQCK
jgi:hypothetical protein